MLIFKKFLLSPKYHKLLRKGSSSVVWTWVNVFYSIGFRLSEIRPGHNPDSVKDFLKESQCWCNEALLLSQATVTCGVQLGLQCASLEEKVGWLGGTTV